MLETIEDGSAIGSVGGPRHQFRHPLRKHFCLHRHSSFQQVPIAQDLSTYEQVHNSPRTIQFRQLQVLAKLMCYQPPAPELNHYPTQPAIL